jgi:Rhodopirellula transposase DDE domain
MGEQKWTRRTLRQLSGRLASLGYAVSHQTVGRLLKDQKYALHVNAKKREASEGHPDRKAQFEQIDQQRKAFGAAGWPIISVDTKKKELIGNFKNAGRAWSQEAEEVNVHDFRQESLGRAVPYGVDDLTHNRGTVVVGNSADTPVFAVAALTQWWDEAGCDAFPHADHLLILADGGGSNGYRPRRWKQQLQERLCDQRGLTVTVCHFPPGCSKWNPIEHRLLGPISCNWAGKPLRTWETLLACLRGTTTTTGLTVSTLLDEAMYETGQTVSDAQMNALNLEHHPVCPTWNYTLRPRNDGAADAAPPTSIQELVS